MSVCSTLTTTTWIANMPLLTNYLILLGTCHKWLFNCKGSAFLWAKQEVQNILSPVVTVHWDADFVKNFLRQGTRDETAFVCAGVAVNFYQHIGFQRLQKRNSEMVIRMALRLAEMWGTEILAPAESKSWLFFRS